VNGPINGSYDVLNQRRESHKNKKGKGVLPIPPHTMKHYYLIQIDDKPKVGTISN
jgi:hypothetical protein